MPKFNAYFHGQRVTVEAPTAGEAKLAAQSLFRDKPRAAYEVSVLLLDEAGKEIPSEGASMCGYIGFFNSKRVEVYAETLWDAKQKVMFELKVKPKQAGMVSVMLAEKNGEPVVHVADM